MNTLFELKKSLDDLLSDSIVVAPPWHLDIEYQDMVLFQVNHNPFGLELLTMFPRLVTDPAHVLPPLGGLPLRSKASDLIITPLPTNEGQVWCRSDTAVHQSLGLLRAVLLVVLDFSDLLLENGGHSTWTAFRPFIDDLSHIAGEGKATELISLVKYLKDYPLAFYLDPEINDLPPPPFPPRVFTDGYLLDPSGLYLPFAGELRRTFRRFLFHKAGDKNVLRFFITLNQCKRAALPVPSSFVKGALAKHATILSTPDAPHTVDPELPRFVAALLSGWKPDNLVSDLLQKEASVNAGFGAPRALGGQRQALREILLGVPSPYEGFDSDLNVMSSAREVRRFWTTNKASGRLSWWAKHALNLDLRPFAQAPGDQQPGSRFESLSAQERKEYLSAKAAILPLWYHYWYDQGELGPLPPDPLRSEMESTLVEFAQLRSPRTIEHNFSVPLDSIVEPQPGSTVEVRTFDVPRHVFQIRNFLKSRTGSLSVTSLLRMYGESSQPMTPGMMARLLDPIGGSLPEFSYVPSHVHPDFPAFLFQVAAPAGFVLDRSVAFELEGLRLSFALRARLFQAGERVDPDDRHFLKFLRNPFFFLALSLSPEALALYRQTPSDLRPLVMASFLGKSTIIQRAVFESLLPLTTPVAQVAPILEPLKVRVITSMPYLSTWVADAMRCSLWRYLKRMPVFSLIGRPLSPDLIAGLHARTLSYSPLLFGTGPLFWTSGDYQSATDLIKYQYSKLAFDEVRRVVASYKENDVLLPFLDQCLEPCTLTYPPEYEIDDVPQLRGQLMGMILSFPLLCILNLFTFFKTLPDSERARLLTKRGRRDLSSLPVLVNGDDILFRSTLRFRNLWLENLGIPGFFPSQGKNYVSRDFLMVNSTGFLQDDPDDLDLSTRLPIVPLPAFTTGSWADANEFGDLYLAPPVLDLSPIPYSNLGLLIGQTKLGNMGQGQGLSLPEWYRLAVHGSFNPGQAHRFFLNYHIQEIKALTRAGHYTLNLFAHPLLGGLGFPLPLGVDPGFSSDQRQIAFSLRHAALSSVWSGRLSDFPFLPALLQIKGELEDFWSRSPVKRVVHSLDPLVDILFEPSTGPYMESTLPFPDPVQVELPALSFVLLPESYASRVVPRLETSVIRKLVDRFRPWYHHLEDFEVIDFPYKPRVVNEWVVKDGEVVQLPVPPVQLPPPSDYVEVPDPVGNLLVPDLDESWLDLDLTPLEQDPILVPPPLAPLVVLPSVRNHSSKATLAAYSRSLAAKYDKRR